MRVTQAEVDAFLENYGQIYPAFLQQISLAQRVIEGLFSSAIHGVTIGAITKVLGANAQTAIELGMMGGAFAGTSLGFTIIARALLEFARAKIKNDAAEDSQNKPPPRSYWPDGRDRK